MCIKTDFFMTEISTNFICGICNGYMNDPVILRCNSQKLHIFGKKCIDKIFDKQKNKDFFHELKCPYCNISVKEPEKYIPLNDIFQYKNIELKCENKCGWVGKYVNYKEHFALCGIIKFTCVCGETMEEYKTNDHLKKECPEHTVKCDFCHNSMKREIFYKKNHGLPTRCLMCKKDIGMCTIKIHDNTECEYRNIKCHLCKKTIVFNEKEKHYNICPNSVVRK